MKNRCPNDLVDNKVNAIYIIYKKRKYDSTDTEHNYLFSCGMDNNHRGLCFLEDEKTTSVYGVAGVSPIIWIFQISLPITIIHVERINGTLFVLCIT